MKKNPQNKEEIKDNEMKKGFFKKVWYSVNKIEKYSELSAEGLGKAIKYFIMLIIIVSIISSAATVFKTSTKIKMLAKYIEDNAPELSYSNEILRIDSQEPIISESSDFGKLIIDTNTEDEQKINQYVNDIENQNAIIILKDRLILKEFGLQGTTNYNYKELFGEMGITEFNKQNLVEYLSGSNMMSIYLNLFILLLIYAIVIQIVNMLFYVIIISMFGYLATVILRLKIRYVAIFNMAVYSLTLPTILYILYMILNTVFNYVINYFELMYILVASIYMIAAVFILKIDFTKKQGEVQKIIEVEKEVKEQIKEKQEDEKEEKQENKTTDKKKKDKKEKETQDLEDGEQPEGSNA